MSEASKALAEVRGWLCDNLDASHAGHVCGMLSVVSRRVVQADDLESENAKLRELVRDLWPFVKAGWVHACPNRECCLFDECDADSEYECPIEEHMAGRMRELGVEVDG